MEERGRGFRYKLEHLGDIFVEAIDHAVERVKASFWGVSLTYEIHSLRTTKKNMVCSIGERVVEIRKIDPAVQVTTDDQAISLFAEFDEIEQKLEASIMEREARVNRWRVADASVE